MDQRGQFDVVGQKWRTIQCSGARDSGERKSLFVAWLKFGVASLLVACITPYGPESILVTGRIFGLGDVLNTIAEWKSPDFQKQPAQEIVLLVALYLALSRGLKLPLLRLLHAEGRLTPVQAAFLARTRPSEELYDLEADPGEAKNLASTRPEVVDRLKALALELEATVESMVANLIASRRPAGFCS